MKAKIPVLMYHEVTTDVEFMRLRRRLHPDYILSPAAFLQQMRYLAEHDYHTLSAAELTRAVRSRTVDQLPDHSVVITFDDGFAGNFEHALPILSQYQLQASFCITVNEIGTADMMSWQQLNALSRAGMEILSHLLNHVIMSELSRAEAGAELHQSRALLQQRLPAPVELLSLPNGSYHADYNELAREAGYIGGFSSCLGYVESGSNPYLLERIPVRRHTHLDKFVQIVSASERVLRGARLKRRTHNMLNHLVGESRINRWYHKVHRIVAPGDQGG